MTQLDVADLEFKFRKNGSRVYMLNTTSPLSEFKIIVNMFSKSFPKVEMREHIQNNQVKKVLAE